MAKTIYKKKIKNGKEYYFYRLRHENLSTPKDIYATSVKELQEKIKAIKYELDNEIVTSNESFSIFLFNWLFDVKFLQVKPSTQERYEILYRKYIKDSRLSQIKIRDITLADIQTYYSKLLKNGTSVNCILNVNKLVTPCIRYAYNNNLILKDFTKSIILPKEDQQTKLNKENKVKPFTLDEQIRFISAIKGHELEILFITALNTGMRQGELFALTWKDINFKKLYIDVNKTAKGVTEVSKEGRKHWKTIVQTPKTVKSIRHIPIPYDLADLLKKHKIHQLELKLKLANQYEDNDLVFCTMYGKYLNSSNVRKRFNTIIDNMNASNENDKNKLIAPRRFHDLRHSYATRLFELREDPRTVQELMGHSNVATTSNTYTHVLNGMKENAVSKLNSLFSTMMGN